MKKLHALLVNLLFGLNAFILFFLLFESRIVIPPVLQVIGRMHPLVLHFPIVLLVLAWLLVAFGKSWAFPWPALRRFVYFLLFISAGSAAVTVLAGLFLANEESYGGDTFRWHKWTGIAVCLLAALLLWSHRRATARERYRPLFVAGLSAAVAVLLVAGHFGASLTHGADYLLEPLRRDEPRVLNMETAIVYTDLVYPILQAKCLGCHDDNKSKGGLILADTASLLRGGDTGPALVRGSAEESLIIERLLLDLDHKHRMPPKEKPQLTEGELALVQAWVRSGADFTLPVAALPTGDTIRQLAVAVYGPPASEQYDFPAAESLTVSVLNTPYRVVRPLAQDLPALEARFYGKGTYIPETLQELSAIATQLTSLNLSGMPVTVTDSETLRGFSNLRELMLNDTPIDDTWGAMLASLPKLRRVSVSGTELTASGLSDMLQSESIRAVFVWNTPIDTVALATIRQQHPGVRIEVGFVDDGNVVLPLNRPTIVPASSFFRNETSVLLKHPISGVELRYTLDGSAPDSLNAAVYVDPFTIGAATQVRVRAYKSGWLASEEVSQTFHRSAVEPQEVSLESRPHPRYRGREALAFFDLQSGGDNHADGKWIAFHGQEMAATMTFDTPIRVDTIGIHVKQDYGPHIYPPHLIEIWAGKDSANAVLLAKKSPSLAPPGQAAARRLISIGIFADGVGYIRAVVKPIVPIPDGYPGAANPAWIFVDEIVIF